MTRYLPTFLAAAAVALCLTAVAQASGRITPQAGGGTVPLTYTAKLSGAQETPPTSSTDY